MRFDGLAAAAAAAKKNATTAAAASGGTAANPPRMKPLPASMQAKELPATYTPYPLPRHDASFEYGPTVLGNVPDVHAARRRELASSQGEFEGDDGGRADRTRRLAQSLAAEAAAYDFAAKPPMRRSVRTALLEEAEEQKARQSAGAAADDLFAAMEGEAEDGATGGPLARAATAEEQGGNEKEARRRQKAEADEEEAETLEDIRRLEAFQKKINEAIAARASEQRRADTVAKGADLPVQYRRVDHGSDHENRNRDTIECVKPISELLETFSIVGQDRRKDTRHILTLYDLMSTIPRQTREEFIAVLNAVAAQFDVTSQRKIALFERPWMTNLTHDSNSGTMRPYYALLDAYKAFHYAVETELMVENPAYLYDAEVLTAVYRLFAHSQFRNLPTWFSTRELKHSNATNSIAGPTTQKYDFDPASLLWGGMYDIIAGDVTTLDDATTPLAASSSSSHHGSAADEAAESSASHWLLEEGAATRPQLAALLSAMVAADPHQQVDGPAARRILNVYFAKFEAAKRLEKKKELSSSSSLGIADQPLSQDIAAEAEALGELCLACTVGTIPDARPFTALLWLVKTHGAAMPAQVFTAITKNNNPAVIDAIFDAVNASSSQIKDTNNSISKDARELNTALARLRDSALGKQQQPADDEAAASSSPRRSNDSLPLMKAQLLGDRKSYAVSRLAMMASEAMEERYTAAMRAAKDAAKAVATASSSDAAAATAEAAAAVLVAADAERGALAEGVREALSSVYPPTTAALVSRVVGIDTTLLEHINGFGRELHGLTLRDRDAARRALEEAEAEAGDEEEEVFSYDELALTAGRDTQTWIDIQRTANAGLIVETPTDERYLARNSAITSTAAATNNAVSASTATAARAFKDPFEQVAALRALRSITVFHSGITSPLQTIGNALRHANGAGTDGLIFTTATLIALQQKMYASPRRSTRAAMGRLLRMIAVEAARDGGLVFVVPASRELLLRGPVAKGDVSEAGLVWLARNEAARVAPGTSVLVAFADGSLGSNPHLAGQLTTAGAAPIGSHPKLIRDIVDGARYYKGGQHARDNVQQGAFGAPAAKTHGRVFATKYRPVTDKRAGADGYYRRRVTFWVGKDGGVRDKVRLSPSERFGYGMLQGATGEDIRNMGIYAPDHPNADARLSHAGGAASAEPSTVESSRLPFRPSEDHPLSERSRARRREL